MQRITLAAAGVLLGLGLTGAAPAPAPRADALRDSVVHLLNRVTYGARPGDVERVMAVGINRFLDRQLAPHTVPDAAVQPHLERLDVLRLSNTELARAYRADRADRLRRQRADSGGDPSEARPRRDRPPATRRYMAELQHAAIVRAVMSERQLYEVMVDFWTNHFNVYAAKGSNRFLMRDYVEETIRPRAMGTFEDLLLATARSPAMLIYLDNAQSVAPGAEPPPLARVRRAMANGRMDASRRARLDTLRERLERRRPNGLNENYARELLELHTLGVDGGYTQHDVEQVARILTGWGLDWRRDRVPRFTFNAWAHDGGPKTVMGQTFAAEGLEQGETLLRWLARHPATRRHVGARLCERFVADTPPPACIAVADSAWVASGGQIPEILRAILTHPVFWAGHTRGTKVTTPLEFVVRAVRALNGVPDTTPRLAHTVRRLGQPLFLESAPTGYGERQDDWVSSSALLLRMEIAMALAAGRLPGVRVDLAALLPDTLSTGASVERVNALFLGGRASPATLTVLAQRAGRASDGPRRRTLLAGLAIGSPDFQRQ